MRTIKMLASKIHGSGEVISNGCPQLTHRGIFKVLLFI
jgi:hypothetical protein